MHSPIRAAVRLLLLALFIVLFLPPMFVCWKRGYHRFRDGMVHHYWKLACLILGIHVLTVGKMDSARPLLLVSNHSSYYDVFVLGSHAPVRFTPKSDVAGWPVIGKLCHMVGCIFIDRSRQRTAEQRDKIQSELVNGTAISLFPEGTTGDGIRMLPFRSSLFALAEETYDGKPLTIQPVTIAYRKLNALPILTRFMPWVAWYGDMEFLSHFWHLAGLKSLEVALQFHPSYTVSSNPDRKEIAIQMHRTIAEALPALRSERNLDAA